MTKTPEEMAEEIENLAILDISLMVHNDSEWHVAKKAWFAGYKAAQPQWISVKDRLPSEHLDTLFFSRQHSDCFVGYRVKPNEWFDPEGNGLTDAIILKYYTHWMPLPSVEGLKNED